MGSFSVLVGGSLPYRCRFFYDLMDEPLVGLDCCLSNADDIDGVKTSPSHSSDSGYSESEHNTAYMADFELLSPLSSCAQDENDNSILESPTHIPDSLSYDVFDDELASYLSVPDTFSDLSTNECGVEESEACNELDSKLNTPQNVATTCNSALVHSKLLQTLPSPVLHEDCRSVFKQETVGFQPVIRAQSPVSSTSAVMPQPQKKLPAVKVVKVVRTKPNTTTMENTIIEALDERNRRNAKQAKMNREKKKAYISGLENDVAALQTENRQLKDTNQRVVEEKSVLEEEIQYLRHILANQSTLSNMLKNIENVKNVRLTSSFSVRKRSTDHDHDYLQPTSSKVPRLDKKAELIGGKKVCAPHSLQSACAGQSIVTLNDNRGSCDRTLVKLYRGGHGVSCVPPELLSPRLHWLLTDSKNL
ncbi:hypothetical protein ScPMuIL_013315 [Solemya velum]